MPYTKSRSDWQDGAGGGTPITQVQLDTIEQGIADAHAGLIDNGAIGTTKIADLAVTGAKIANDTITATQISANAVGASELADSAVDTAAIVDGAVTATKIATATKKVTVATAFATAAFSTNARYPDGSQSFVAWQFQVPGDYVSGDITFKHLIRSGVTDANTMRLILDAIRFRDATAINQFVTDADKSLTGWTSGQDKLLSHTLAAANFQAGDVLYVELTREGAHASDTHTGNGVDDGAWIEYTGRI